MASTPTRVSDHRLDSWKEIAAFFHRAERTVRRWETERGLPVHRVPGGGRSAVFAYTSELGDWLKGRSAELAADDSAELEAVAEPDKPASPTLAEIPALAEVIEMATPAVPTPAVAANPAVHPTTAPSRFQPARLAAWIVPLLFAAAVIFYISFGHDSFHARAFAGRHESSAEAQDLYLKGRYFWDRRTPEDLNKAIDYFTQAIVKDPSSAQAYVGLADCYNLLREFGAMPPNEAYPRAISAAQRAVDLDDSSAEAHLSLAFGSFWWSWRGVTAEREFRRAIELDPKLVRGHHWYATYLMGVHRYAEGLDQIQQAQRLDPSSAAILADKGIMLWSAGRRSEGQALLEQVAASEPTLSSTHDYLGRIAWQQKNYVKALAEFRRFAELRNDRDGLALADAREKGFAAGGLTGLYQEELPLEKQLVDRGSGSAYELATAYAALGQRQDALRYLQLSFDRHEAAMLFGDPIPELENDPALLKFRAQVTQLLAQ
ncbi:MAG TPA: tetratricopeptide repeat protein [Candidatus Sulfotelmatobacter sp.]|nr:tetratricopeptide repeat protein [Candidatus Sulfotelmatobacter sp.]